MPYPGRIIRMGEPPGPAFQAIKDRLQLRGYREVDSCNNFDDRFRGAVRRFQSQHYAPTGEPLLIDGQIGPLTWFALFGWTGAPIQAATPLAARVTEVANSQLGNREYPPYTNRGPEVDEYQRSVGVQLPPIGQGEPWCMAFVYWCFERAAQQLGERNPFPKTPKCSEVWAAARPQNKLSKDVAKRDIGRVRPGAVFIHDYGDGTGHTGIIAANNHGSFITIEGNTTPNGEREGLAVLLVNRRTIMDPSLVGFVGY